MLEFFFFFFIRHTIGHIDMSTNHVYIYIYIYIYKFIYLFIYFIRIDHFNFIGMGMKCT